MASRDRSRSPRRQCAVPPARVANPFEAFRPFVDRHRAAAGGGGGIVINYATNQGKRPGVREKTNILRIMGGGFPDDFLMIENLADLGQVDAILRRELSPGSTYNWQLILTWNVEDDPGAGFSVRSPHSLPRPLMTL